MRQACAEQGIALEQLGPAAGRVSDRVEDELPAYDLVFATARMALEAASVGCAVVVCDARGFAGLLTIARLPAWRRLNFGAGLLAETTDAAMLRAAIEEYDADDAARVTDSIRAEASIDHSVSRHLEVYAAALKDPAPVDLPARAAATAAWIEDLVPGSADRDWRKVVSELHGLAAEPHPAFFHGMEERLREAGERQLTEVRAANDASAAGLMKALDQMRDEIGQPSAARMLWRRLVPLAIRQELHRFLRNR